ncbi:MAG: hypothetical protein AAFN81_03445 [Bacteroidota bacterium]
MNSRTDNELSDRLEYFKESFGNYVKIFALYLLVPAWIVGIIHTGVVGWKVISWFENEVAFLQNSEYVISAVLVFLFPILYLTWFYYLTIEKSLKRLYDDWLIDWNVDFGERIADFMIQRNFKPVEDTDLADIVNHLNSRINNLPKIFKWLARKILDKIPLLELINTLEIRSNERDDKADLADRITNKLNQLQLEIIDAIVPSKFFLIVPINVLLLGYFLKL